MTRMNKLNDGWGGQNTRKKKSRARQIHADLFFFGAGQNLGSVGRNLGSVGRNLGVVGQNCFNTRRIYPHISSPV